MHQQRFPGGARLAPLLAVAVGLWSRTVSADPSDVVHIGNRIVIPVDDVFDTDGDDATIKASLLSNGGQLAHQLAKAVQSGRALVSGPGIPVTGTSSRGNSQGGNGVGSNVQVNDPALDHIVTFPPDEVVTRPFEFSTQSETSVVNHGRHIVVGYNSSANQVVEFFPGFGLAFTQRLLTAFSTSHDGGRTWTSGFVPPVSPDAPFTFGDPALASDRQGNIFYASIGTDAVGKIGININKSADNGDTWSPGIVAVTDDGVDKDWLAIGPDPTNFSRDNLYVTWTHFTDVGSELWLARSIDGGNTWTLAQLFAPVDNGTTSSSFIQFSNPVVDPVNGRLYIPFLHFSDIDADNVRVLVSDDGGNTFRFLAFNQPGAPDPFAFTNVTPGILNYCTGGGFRNALHQGSSLGTGPLGSFIYTQATRLVTQPAAAVFGGRVLIALQSSTSPTLFDPSAGSLIRVLFSRDGGNSWADPLTIAASTAGEPQHVHPAITLGAPGNKAWVGYYAQQSNEQLNTKVARVQVTGNKLKLRDTSALSNVSFDLTPSNVPRLLRPFTTTNYDRSIQPCYDIGEYMSIQSIPFFSDDGGNAAAAWGDNRQRWTGPPGSPAPFEHAQPDVFFAGVGGGDD